jgi:hypothetical protein
MEVAGLAMMTFPKGTLRNEVYLYIPFRKEWNLPVLNESYYESYPKILYETSSRDANLQKYRTFNKNTHTPQW